MSHSYWDKRNTTIFNHVGHWHGEEVVIEGHKLFEELMPSSSYMQVYLLNATGRLVDRNVADWLEKLNMGVSYPDARIWCNQIAAYAADMGCKPASAICAAQLAADSRAYGGSFSRYKGMTSLQDIYARYQLSGDFSKALTPYLNRNNIPIVVGFARPIEKKDERLEPLEKLQNDLGIERGVYLEFAFKLAEYIYKHYKLQWNIGGYSDAFLLDQKFTPDDGYRIGVVIIAGGAIGAYRSQVGQHCGNSFLPQKCDDIRYSGPALRELPK
ncbi:MAG: hypothetical protein ACI93R_001282 [Flavobacteriales bacterium]|jgi:hypothetical protein